MAPTVAPLHLFDAAKHDWVLLDDESASSDGDLAEALLHESASRIQRAARARAQLASKRQGPWAHGPAEVDRGLNASRWAFRILALLATTAMVARAFADQNQAEDLDEQIKLLAAPPVDLKTHALVPFRRLQPWIHRNEHAVLVHPSFQGPLELSWEITSIHLLVAVLLFATTLDRWSSKKVASKANGSFVVEEERIAEIVREPIKNDDRVAATTRKKGNPWNDFQRCVGGCTLDRKNVSTLYRNFKEAAQHSATRTQSCSTPTPKALLISSARTWEGFCASVSGCGLDQEKLTKLFEKVHGMAA